MQFKAFADDQRQLMIENLTLENQGDRLSIYGSLQITADLQGLKHAKQLTEILQQAIAYLEQQNLPEKLLPPDDAEEVENPFWQAPKDK